MTNRKRMLFGLLVIETEFGRVEPIELKPMSAYYSKVEDENVQVFPPTIIQVDLPPKTELLTASGYAKLPLGFTERKKEELDKIANLQIDDSDVVAITLWPSGPGCHIYEDAFLRVARQAGVTELDRLDHFCRQLRFRSHGWEFITIVEGCMNKIAEEFSIRVLYER